MQKKNETLNGVEETPSLQWIHRVRRDEQLARRKRPPRPLTRREAEKLARRYGLELARRAPAER
jgi:hypothetical protein